MNYNINLLKEFTKQPVSFTPAEPMSDAEYTIGDENSDHFFSIQVFSKNSFCVNEYHNWTTANATMTGHGTHKTFTAAMKEVVALLNA